MLIAKSLLDNLCDKKGNTSFSREHQMCQSLHVYSEKFNKEKAYMWFVKIPSCIQFRGNYTFIIEGMKDKLHFAPSTIADFISIVQSLGYDLEVRILYEEDQSDVEENAMVRKLIQ